MVILLFAVLAISMAADAVARERREVVVIHSYHQDYPWTALQHEGFTGMLSSSLPDYDINFSVEYLDTKRVKPSPGYLQKFLYYLQAKHAGDTPDLIYVTDDNAMNFMLAAGVLSFRSTPVVFSGVNNLSLGDTLDRQRITGVFERKGVERSVNLVRQIRPQTKRIIFLGDGGPTDQAISAGISGISRHYTGLEIVRIGMSSKYELLDSLKTAGPGVVIVTSIGGVHDENGRVLELDEVMREITGTGRMVLVMEDGYLFPGVLGGYVTTARLQGESAARLAVRIIRGEPVSDVEPVKESLGELVFDWNTLQHFGIRLNEDLLDSARIINQPLPFLDRHPQLVWWVLGIFITIAVIIIGIFVFVTQRKNRIIREQTTDDLTGLPNRTRLLQDTLSMSNPRFAVIDINNFKAINSFYGLDTGDAVLVAVSREIACLLPGGTRLYRMGRDQFGVLADGAMQFAVFRQLIARIVEALRDSHLSIGEPEIHLTASAGISGRESTTLIAGAEQALHIARERNEGYAVDDDALEDAERQKQNILWANKLSTALETGRIRPFFQPIIHNASGKQTKYEALVRLIDEDGSVVTPFFFLEAAKRTRQYAILTRTMIEQSLDMLGDRAVSISLNFTVEDIRNSETVHFFKQKLNEYNAAGRVVVELIESEGIENYEEVSRFIAEIKRLGCRVAIDDFGTGYSNFTHLMHLNADYLKIDGSIIKRINDDRNSELVTRTLVDFARRLGMETIAEYVDSQAVLDKVTALGVDYSQGFFLGKPAPELPRSAGEGQR
ncbi:diguanylate cyclase (GGDEF)-like protein [Thiogranum longum]|uniref:Diguanylate cyclase (GGDEF)-like protein n=1 Tax=Thiogranum longum TaxID=1537524 RepID=A0A4R1HFH1_9GAMM|nr:ABC transporter substrate binding protein [Thiogranum longum]TCK19095.1 diguanylate cyclase (GGDEF)-like protein [Thiogranum longum]